MNLIGILSRYGQRDFGLEAFQNAPEVPCSPTQNKRAQHPTTDSQVTRVWKSNRVSRFMILVTHSARGHQWPFKNDLCLLVCWSVNMSFNVRLILTDVVPYNLTHSNLYLKYQAYQLFCSLVSTFWHATQPNATVMSSHHQPCRHN